MTSSIRLPETVGIASHVQGEAPHRLAVAVYAEANSWAMAVVNVAAPDGEVLAWDGWYFEDLSPEHLDPVATLDFDDFDDMRSKLLVQRNREWLGGPLAHHLMPTYSFADLAARIVWTHADSNEDADSRRGFGEGALVAYFPVTDGEAVRSRIEGFVASSSGVSAFGTGRDQRAVDLVRDALA